MKIVCMQALWPTDECTNQIQEEYAPSYNSDAEYFIS